MNELFILKQDTCIHMYIDRHAHTFIEIIEEHMFLFPILLWIFSVDFRRSFDIWPIPKSRCYSSPHFEAGSLPHATFNDPGPCSSWILTCCRQTQFKIDTIIRYTRTHTRVHTHTQLKIGTERRWTAGQTVNTCAQAHRQKISRRSLSKKRTATATKVYSTVTCTQKLHPYGCMLRCGRLGLSLSLSLSLDLALALIRSLGKECASYRNIIFVYNLFL